VEGTTPCIQAPSTNSRKPRGSHALAARYLNRHTDCAASASPAWSGGAVRPSPPCTRHGDGADGRRGNEAGAWRSPRRSSALAASGATSDHLHACRHCARNRPVRRFGRSGRQHPAGAVRGRTDGAAANSSRGTGAATLGVSVRRLDPADDDLKTESCSAGTST
jgi:hypothetical protein